jgi:hypothetical protein
MRIRNTLTILLALPFFTASLPAQSGGTFAISHSVLASGGGQQTTGGTFSVDGTIGQAAAGDAIGGPPFAVSSGFWNFAPSAPTAATVGISGQVRTADGRGIRNAVLTLTSAQGSVRTAISSAFGYYVFVDVTAGETYILSISTKRYSFAGPAMVLPVFDSVAGLDFIADPPK